MPTFTLLPENPKVACPRCHGATILGGGKPCCLACGWNLDAAETHAGHHLKNVPIGIALLAGFYLLLFVVFRQRQGDSWSGWPFAIFVVVGGIFLAQTLVKEWKALKQIEAIRKRTTIPASATGPARPEWDQTTLEGFRVLSSIARPRLVRMSRRGKIDVAVLSLLSLVVLVPILAFFLEPATRETNWHSLLFEIFWIVFVVAGGFGLAREFRKQVRGRDLLREGEITLGRVTGQAFTGSKHPKSRISYEYQDRAGGQYQGSDTDQNRTLFEEMPIPIFYDSLNPSKHIPEFVSIWEVVLPKTSS